MPWLSWLAAVGIAFAFTGKSLIGGADDETPDVFPNAAFAVGCQP
jgi:hypothetical protein